MFDYWVSNEVYFDAGDITPSVVMPNCYCIKSKNVAMYQVKHFFKEDIKTSLNILWISPYATGYGGELMVEEELIC